MNIFSVENLVVVITGAGSGIGLALANSFKEHKANVISINHYKKDDDDNTFQCDLNSEKEIEYIVAIILQKFGHIDVLINNAGVSFAGYDKESWRKTMDVNLDGVFRMSYLVLESMRTRLKGSVINITSICAQLGFPNNPSYQASKAAVRQLTRAMAYDYAQFNIRVNNICPGYIKTKMTRNSYADQNMKSERDNHIMLGRWGEPKDFVGPCIFLASEASSYITATDIYVDGGWTSKGL